MQSTTLILLLAAMSMAAFYFGRRRSLALVGGPGQSRRCIRCPVITATTSQSGAFCRRLLLLFVWMMVEPRVIVALVIKGLPESYRSAVATASSTC